MKKKIKEVKVSNIIIFTLCLVIILFTYYSIKSSSTKNNIKIEEGKLDLSKINLSEDPYSIIGEWEFYFGKLLYQENEFDKNQKSFIKLPDSWTNYMDKNNNNLQAQGTATYRIRIKVNDYQKNIGIKLNNIWGKSRILIKEKDDIVFEEGFSNEVVKVNYFNIKGNDFDLIIQMKNEDTLKSGILKSIYIGSESSITHFRDKYLFIDISCIVSFIMLAFYFFTKAYSERDFKINISLGVYSLTVAAFLSFTDEILITRIFLSLTMWNIYCLTIVLGLISTLVLIVYVNECYKIGLTDKVIVIFGVIYSIYLVVIFNFPKFRKVDIGRVQAVLGIIIIIIGVIIITKSIFSNKEETRFNVLAILSIVLMTLVVIYNTFSKKQINFLVPLYMLIFTISQALLLSYKQLMEVREIKVISENLKLLDKKKDIFLERTSYELKLPLKGIINISKSLINGVAGELTSSQKENIKMITSVSNRLSILVDDILDYSGFANGLLENSMEVINLKSIIFLAVNIIEYSIKDKPISIKTNIGKEVIIINGNKERLKQVFYNLIDTILTFTEKGEVVISSNIVNGKVKISISNSDLIVEEEAKKFSSMKNIDWDNSLYSNEKKSAISLWVVKTIIDVHNGEIYFTSKEGIGTEFLVILPMVNNNILTGNDINEGIISEEEKIDSKEIKKNGYSILILESNEINRKVLNNTLNMEGYITNNIYSSNDLINLIDKGIDEDLLIMNSYLPNSSGYDLLKKIRSKYNSIDLPVIMIVDNAYPENIPLALYLDANDVLIEPYYIEELKARVKTLIELKKTITSLITSEMSFLKAQIKPHFIFNALSVISSLIPRDPIKAKNLLLDFSDYLRNSFDFNYGEDLVYISKEIELTKAYVAIEKERFKKRLTVNFDIEEDINVKIPSLIIQPIVENAIRHGVLNKISGGNIFVKINCEENNVIIKIKDDGIGIPKDKVISILNFEDKTAGVGIKNINSRLIRKYGQGIAINSIEGYGTEVIIKIPLL